MSFQTPDKIVFAGPVGAGKTTAIGSVSEIEPIGTDVKATDQHAAIKEKTTVAMDYGFIRLRDGQQIHLYGTPGQDRFDFMWDVLTQNGLGLVLLVNVSRPDPVADLMYYLSAFESFISSTGVAIGLTQCDKASKNIFDLIRGALEEKKMLVPILEVDVRRQHDVTMLIHALLAVLECKEKGYVNYN